MWLVLQTEALAFLQEYPTTLCGYLLLAAASKNLEPIGFLKQIVKKTAMTTNSPIGTFRSYSLEDVFLKKCLCQLPPQFLNI